MGTKLLYLVRHGEANGDDKRSELTETGRHQAVLLGERLRGVPFTGIHHSPLARAAQTAEIVGELEEGPPQAAAALEYFARTSETDECELVISHNFVLGWFIRDVGRLPPSVDRW
ncbi:histidine phosphatase family protein [Amycolatopsis sp.]|uniref:histidine phosphatase family protein n=1 Tax=Amycolatopsis sp. TaxID=37632 RepID=UPI002E02BED5|nr:histidine phosphatase family protein [Amycolatopsis sp.]